MKAEIKETSYTDDNGNPVIRLVYNGVEYEAHSLPEIPETLFGA